MARVGLLGGTFNPPHLAHLVCAQEAWAQLGLDRVVLVPAGVPPHKEAPGDPGREERLELCRCAVAGDERLDVSRVELDRPGASYTVDTLRDLRDAWPGDELIFIVGGDMGRDLPNWKQPERVLELAEVAVAERAGAARREIREAVASLRGAHERLRFLDMPRLDISSSLVRSRVATGRPVRYLVPDLVAERIADRGLYRDGAT